MKHLLLALSIVLSTGAIAQDKEKVSTGHKDIISSVITNVAECKTNYKDLLRQITQAYDSQRTSIDVEYSISFTTDQVIRMYDKKKTKVDGNKKEEIINIREVNKTGIVKTQRFYESIALYKQKYSKKKEAYVTKRRKIEQVIAEASATLLSVEQQCLNYKDRLEQK